MLRKLFFLFGVIFLILKNWISWCLVVYILILLILNILIEVRDELFIINVGYSYIMDVLSWGIIILTAWISILIVIRRKTVFRIKNFRKIFLINVLFLMLILILTFRSRRILIFYIYFESRLIFTLLLIIGWGYQPERLQAGLYILIYTLFASLPLLLILFLFFLKTNRFIFVEIKIFDINIYIILGLIIAFLVKFPIVYFHYWLPKAHVEAPVGGSIILAGVLLKLGGYGILRLFPLVYIKTNYSRLLMRLTIVGCRFIRILCLRQIDLKCLIAYSSVVHIGLTLGGILRIRIWGINGRYLLIIAHGLSSSGLFSISNIFYERIGSRNFGLNRGLINIIPRIILFWFLLRCFNGAAPPSLNLWGEICILSRLIRWTKFNLIIIIVIRFFRVCYLLYIYRYIQHGKTYEGLSGRNRGLIIEYLRNFFHLVPLVLIILNLDYLLVWIYLNSLIKIMICGIIDI